ncbi:hypothetical protein [Sphingomonas glacialis]|uniref:hypothetical protein n=1 Tax=Sphingomonas glacialis TaxID=658225 RepID=UPI0013870086|nr:hypothetical protein [Sphingomonas glacialis]
MTIVFSMMPRQLAYNDIIGPLQKDAAVKKTSILLLIVSTVAVPAIAAAPASAQDY